VPGRNLPGALPGAISNFSEPAWREALRLRHRIGSSRDAEVCDWDLRGLAGNVNVLFEKLVRQHIN